MTNVKRQHYVPKFYLRRFSYKNNKKQIGVFNTKTLFFFETAKLKTQSYKPYFYGKDGTIENAFKPVEDKASQLINKISRDNYAPQKQTEDYAILSFFLILSNLRNLATSEKINQSEDNFKKIIEGHGNLMKGYDFSIKNAVGFGLSMIIEAILFSLDLEFKVIVNKTSIPFITSDNPVVKYNQYLEYRKWPGGITGFTTLGIQYFLPLDPQTMIIFYDPWTYKVGERKQKVIDVNSTTEISDLNLLHFLNCNETIYFNHQTGKEEILNLFEKSKKFEKANIAKTKEQPMIYENGYIKPNSSMIIISFSDCKIKLNLSFIKQTKQAKNHMLDNRVVQVRRYCSKAEEIIGKIKSDYISNLKSTV